MLDGFDLGIGILFGSTGDEDFRRTMMNSIAPVWDGNETWLIFVGASLYGGFPDGLLDPAAGLLPAGHVAAGRADPARRRVRIPRQDAACALDLGLGLLPRIARRRLGAGSRRRRDGRRPGGRERALRGRTVRLVLSLRHCCAASALPWATC